MKMSWSLCLTRMKMMMITEMLVVSWGFHSGTTEEEPHVNRHPPVFYGHFGRLIYLDGAVTVK